MEFGVDEREVRCVLRLTQKLGGIDQIAQDHFFAREVMREMAVILREVAADAPDRWFTAPAFRDRPGFTLCRGDLRRLNPHRADLFDR